MLYQPVVSSIHLLVNRPVPAHSTYAVVKRHEYVYADRDLACYPLHHTRPRPGAGIRTRITPSTEVTVQLPTRAASLFSAGPYTAP